MGPGLLADPVFSQGFMLHRAFLRSTLWSTHQIMDGRESWLMHLIFVREPGSTEPDCPAKQTHESLISHQGFIGCCRGHSAFSALTNACTTVAWYLTVFQILHSDANGEHFNSSKQDFSLNGSAGVPLSLYSSGKGEKKENCVPDSQKWS